MVDTGQSTRMETGEDKGFVPSHNSRLQNHYRRKNPKQFKRNRDL